MKILVLNCRGCCASEVVQELRDLVERFRPELIFLSETKMMAERSELLRWKLGFENAVGVDCTGLGGGLVLMWRTGNIVRLK